MKKIIFALALVFTLGFGLNAVNAQAGCGGYGYGTSDHSGYHHGSYGNSNDGYHHGGNHHGGYGNLNGNGYHQ